MAIPAKDLHLIRIGTPLHDIGKIGIPDAILNKPGKLTPAEFEIMKTHAVKGAKIVETIPDLADVIPIIRNHHERWDGNGYPDGTAGENTHHLAHTGSVTATSTAFGIPRVTLYRLLRRFDPDRGVRLVSFALHWIKAEIHEYILRNWRMMKVATTKAQRKLFFNLRGMKESHVGLTREQAKEIAKTLRVKPEEVFEMFPVLKQMLRRRGGDLSGGQQQQLAIARALVMKPKVLILDEPTEGIQPSIIKEIERVIHALSERGDMAILLVEQYFEFALKLGDRYYVMEKGAIVMRGDYSSTRMGAGQAVQRDFAKRVNFGASDPRKDGAAVAELIRFR
jgi:urea transport system ATP-binding protein